MNLRRMPLLMIFLLAMFIGISLVYLRLWSVDSNLSAHDRELLRRQFDRANMEAMDESAEWRMKFDKAAERAKLCDAELAQVKQMLSELNRKLAAMQKENSGLQGQLDSLKSEKGRCKC